MLQCWLIKVIFLPRQENIDPFLICLFHVHGISSGRTRHGSDFHRPQSQITIDSPDFHPRRSQKCLLGWYLRSLNPSIAVIPLFNFIKMWSLLREL